MTSPSAATPSSNSSPSDPRLAPGAGSAPGPLDPPAARPHTGLHAAAAIPYEIVTDGVGGQRSRRERRMELDAGDLVASEILPHSELRYAVYPAYDSSAAVGRGFEATAVAIDLLLDDGTRISELGAVDEAGYALTAGAQYASRTLQADQWNEKVVDLTPATGRLVAAIELVTLDVGDDPDASSAGLGGGTGASATASTTTATDTEDERSGTAESATDATISTVEGTTRHAPHGWISDVRIVPAPDDDAADPVDLVDVRRGTHSSGSVSRGNNIPAIAVPHGFNFVMPVNDASDLRWPYRYHAANRADNASVLQAMAISHMASPWGGDRNVLHLMPMADAAEGSAERSDRGIAFDHADEVARPYLYALSAEGFGIEATATDHVAVLRLALPAGGGLLLDQYDERGSITIRPDDARAQVTGYTDSQVDEHNPTVQRMYVALRCDQRVEAVRPRAVAARPGVSAVLGFADRHEPLTVTVRVATSFLSIEQAIHSLDLEAPPELGFDEIRDRTRDAWRERLALATIESARRDRRVSFASGLYRMFLYPNHHAENTGSAEAPHWVHADAANPRRADSPDTPTRTGRDVREGESYVNNGFWDTYRTAWPAYALLDPGHAGRLFDGFVQHYRESGWIDRWCSPGPTGGMVGSSGDIVGADALVSGVPLPDAEAAYDAALRDATAVSERGEVGRGGNERAIYLGYAPYDVHEGMSWSLEDALNDFGLHRASVRMLDHTDADHPRRAEWVANAEYFRARAADYALLFDAESGFFRGRDAAGAFRPGSPTSGGPFDPREWGGDYTETNAWGMAFTAPHDGAGLAALYGGADALEAKLDAYFTTPETARYQGTYPTVIHEMTEARNVRMGMFGLSNQPAHHIAYMYAFTGSPHKTQRIVRESIRRLFLGSSIGQGYPGDEDNGEMSAWYMFGTIGLYPLTPASGELVLTSPSVPRAVLAFPGTPAAPAGATTTITAHHYSDENVYIQSVRIDGEPWDRLSVPIELVRSGVSIEFELGPEPSSWGTGPSSAPVSLTPAGARPVPLHERALAMANPDELFTFDSTHGVLIEPGAQRVYEIAGSKEFGTQATATKTASISLYTVTLGAPGAASWRVDTTEDGEHWTELDRQENVTFRWKQQVRAFVPREVVAARAVRVTVLGSQPLDLRELEFFRP